MVSKNKATETKRKLLKVKNSKGKEEQKSNKRFKVTRLRMPMSKYEFDEGGALY